MIKTRSDATQVWVVNQGAGAGSTSIVNSAGWVVNIGNSAGWVFAQSNTSPLVQVQNSAGWIVAVSNTNNVVSIANTANLIVYTIDSRPTGTAVTLVPSTAGQVLILASNALRRGASIYNQSTNPLYIRLGSTVSATTYTLMMVGSGYYEVPNPAYTGIITGIWTAANGAAVVTEIT